MNFISVNENLEANLDIKGPNEKNITPICNLIKLRFFIFKIILKSKFNLS